MKKNFIKLIDQDQEEVKLQREAQVEIGSLLTQIEQRYKRTASAENKRPRSKGARAGSAGRSHNTITIKKRQKSSKNAKSSILQTKSVSNIRKRDLN